MISVSLFPDCGRDLYECGHTVPDCPVISLYLITCVLSCSLCPARVGMGEQLDQHSKKEQEAQTTLFHLHSHLYKPCGQSVNND